MKHLIIVTLIIVTQAGARQTPDVIRSIIKAAVNAIGPDGRPIPNRSYQQLQQQQQQQGGGGADQMETSLDDLWMGAGADGGARRSGGGQVAESRPFEPPNLNQTPIQPLPHRQSGGGSQVPYNQLMTYTNYVVTSGVPAPPSQGGHMVPPRPPVAPQWQQWQTSPLPPPTNQGPYPGSTQLQGQPHYAPSQMQQVPPQHQQQQTTRHQGQLTAEEVSMMVDADLAQMLLGGTQAADQDPHPEPLQPEGMDVSGGVLFDSNLLEMLLKDCQSMQNLNQA